MEIRIIKIIKKYNFTELMNQESIYNIIPKEF